LLVLEGGRVLVELAHAMLWDTYDRATRIQAWMLNQASTYTLELLENNKRLADQASELQKRYQSSMAEIDYMTREKAMMDAEASASRYSRHLIEKARAEAEASPCAALRRRVGGRIGGRRRARARGDVRRAGPERPLEFQLTRRDEHGNGSTTKHA
jgi:hypothetical protein